MRLLHEPLRLKNKQNALYLSQHGAGARCICGIGGCLLGVSWRETREETNNAGLGGWPVGTGYVIAVRSTRMGKGELGKVRRAFWSHTHLPPSCPPRSNPPRRLAAGYEDANAALPWARARHRRVLPSVRAYSADAEGVVDRLDGALKHNRREVTRNAAVGEVDFSGFAKPTGMWRGAGA